MEVGRISSRADGKPRPRFADRERSRAWPCPRRAEFSILLVLEKHDATMLLSGSLDATGRPAFEDCVASACGEWPRRLVLELSALESIDAAGIESLLRVRQRAEATGIELVLDSPNDEVACRVAGASPDGEFFVRHSA